MSGEDELVLELSRRGVRYLAVTWVNHTGSTLVKTVSLPHMEGAAARALGLSPVSDAFTATGGIDPEQSLARPDGDLRLVPDLGQVAILDETLGWAWAPGDRRERTGAAYSADQRSFCRRQLEALAGAGLVMRAGFELEWVVGQETPDGTFRPAVLGSPYGADRLVDGLDYVSAVAEALDRASVAWLQVHPEYGPAQFEVSLPPADPLTAADQVVLAKLVIQRATSKLGLRCSFSPVVELGTVGNGGHMHLSLEQGGVPVLSGGDGPGGLRPAGQAVVAGLLHHLPGLVPLGCALGVSYLRLVPETWSAPFVAWGIENREAALRLVPSAVDGAPATLEYKTADLSANPYLLVGGIAAAIVESIATGRPLPAPVVGDPGQLPQPPDRVPVNVSQAAEALAASELLRDAMGERLHDTLVESRQAEARRVASLTPEQSVASTRWWPFGEDPA